MLDGILRRDSLSDLGMDEREGEYDENHQERVHHGSHGFSRSD